MHRIAGEQIARILALVEHEALSAAEISARMFLSVTSVIRFVNRLLAEKPRVSLVALKDHLVADLRQRLPRCIEQEVALHELTFHQPEVRARIDAAFGR